MKIQNNYLYSLGISKGMTLPDYLVVDRKDRMTEEEVIALMVSLRRRFINLENVTHGFLNQVIIFVIETNVL